MNKEKLINIIQQFHQEEVVVIGDIILDHYLWCDVERISPEAPVPIAKVNKESYTLGGAANVANNLSALGVKAKLIGLIGNDNNGEIIKSMLEDNDIGIDEIINDNGRPTIVKTRVMCGTHQLVRIDYENTHNLSILIEKTIIKKIQLLLNNVKVIILSDYSKGLISKKLAKIVIEIAKRKNIKVLADPTPTSFNKFKNAYLIKPNKKEAESIANIKFDKNYKNIKRVGEKLIKKLKSNIIITLGKDGIAVFEDSNVRIIPTMAQEVYDVSGAGDTTIAAIAAALGCGANIFEAATIGNICAGVVVEKLGTSVCTYEKLIGVIKKYDR